MDSTPRSQSRFAAGPRLAPETGQPLPAPAEAVAHPTASGRALADLDERQRRKGLAAILASLTVAGLAFGTSIPLLSLLLERDGVATALIGLNASTALLAMVLVAPLIPALVRRLGTIHALLGGIAVIAVSFMLLPVFRGLEAWFVLRFLIGIGVAIHWVICETWLNAATGVHNRGFYAGMYATLMGAGFAAGPALLTVIELDGWTPFVVVTVAVALAAVPILWAADCAPRLEISAPGERWSALRTAPTVFAAVLVAGLVESSIMSLFAVYGLRLGMPQGEAVLLVTVTVAGTVALQVPVGRLADRVNRRALLWTTAIIGLCGALLMQVLLEPAAVRWPFLFLWGGVFMGLYTIGLAELGDRFSGSALSGANALYVMTYCIGSMMGPPVAGTVMDWRGPRSFPLVLAGFFTVGLAVACWRLLRRPRPARAQDGEAGSSARRS